MVSTKMARRGFLLIAAVPLLVLPGSINGFIAKRRRSYGCRTDRALNSPRGANVIRLKSVETATICVVGGGVSGLTAALTAARDSSDDCKIVLLEAGPTVGGRVQSDVTEDGFVLDRGFAVFIEEYPFAKQLLDYDDLKLGKFLPGALVKIKDSGILARVADPLRQPEDIFTALFAPVGSLVDKFDVLPLVFHVKSRSIEELFAEPETDTLTALRARWGFSNDMIDKFFRPFLEGIYLAPLEEQSSRMFLFIFKMFSDGAATLPEGGMGAVSKQLSDKAIAAGVDIRTGKAVKCIVRKKKGYHLMCAGGDILADTVIVATESPSAQALLSTVDGLEGLGQEPEQKQRSVGCLYYSFEGKVPVEEPILILNGIGSERGNAKNPVNNICFPSVVSKSYVQLRGSGLCSVTVLNDSMELFAGRDSDLDRAVRQQLATWFPDHEDAILDKWKLERVYKIPNAQPAQLNGPLPASANRGRPSDTYRNTRFPDGLFVCGDHVATATLNGALESGVNAGKAAAAVAMLA